MKSRTIKILCLVCILFIIQTPQLINAQKSQQSNIGGQKEITKAGTYFIEYGVEGEEKETFKAHITFPKTILNYDNNVGIDAHDIAIETGTLESYSDEELIKLANAHAWSMETGEAIPNIEVKIIPAPLGLKTKKTIEYSTTDGTVLQVNIFEQDHIYLPGNELYMNQYAVVGGTIRSLSILIILLTVIPILLFTVVFWIIGKKKKEVTDLLYS